MYEITRVRKVINITPEGGLEECIEVSYKTKKGVESWVRLKTEEYEPSKAKRMIEDEAKKLDAIYGD
jgi:hypothetical protein